MVRQTLLDGAVLIAPKRLKGLDRYLEAFPGASFERMTLSELASLFFPETDEAFLLSCRRIIDLAEEGMLWLLALLPEEPSSPRFLALRALPHFPKKRVPRERFSARNVVFVGFLPLAGRVFSALLQDVPNLSSSWSLPYFGQGAGLVNPGLDELYGVLSEEEIAELCLMDKASYDEAKRQEAALALFNGEEMK